MSQRLLTLEVENFRSLRKISLPLGALNVLVGPNGAGKTTVLEVFRFLADVIRTDLEPALSQRGGFDEVAFWGGESPPTSIRIKLTATWTTHSSLADPDVYELSIERPEAGGAEVATVAGRLAPFRIFDVNVEAARLPARFPRDSNEVLDDGAANLAAFLLTLRNCDEDAWGRLVEDARYVLPQLEDIDFDYPSGAAREVVVVLREAGLRRPTQLADASYGTIKLLGLLALLYDPQPPALTCVEEIDHGLHPLALELLVERLREAGERTQFLITTYSSAFADRLRPDELIVCERCDDGSSAIPALSASMVEGIVAASENLPLGQLWISGALGDLRPLVAVS